MSNYRVGEYIVLNIPENERSTVQKSVLPNGVYKVTEANHLYHWYRLEGCPSGRTYPQRWLAPVNGLVASTVVMTAGSAAVAGPVYYVTQAAEVPPIKHKGDFNMAITLPIVKEITQVGSRNFTEITDDEMFSMIAAVDREIESLEKHITKPKKLLARIEALKAENKKLVALVDARE